MNKTQDAFGRSLLDHLHGVRVFEILERDDGHIATTGAMPLYFSPYPAWPAPEREAMKFVRGRVLDVGCGAGRAALYVQERGHDVLAIDNSPLAIDVCKKRGVRAARVMSITQLNRSVGEFDTILMHGNNFGLFGNPRRTSWLLRRLHVMTSTDARIIAGSRDPYAGIAPEHRSYHARNRERGRMPGQVRIRVRYQRLASPWFDLLMVSRAEMRALLKGTGWHLTDVLGDEQNYVAIIEKDAPTTATARGVQTGRSPRSSAKRSR